MNSTWPLVHAERAALAADLADLTDDRWATTSLCSELTVREVLAHLTAGAVLSFPRWFLGVLRARFDFDRQVVDRLREQLGDSPAETLAKFQAAVNRSTTPLGFRGSPVGALAEQVVHAEDIRRPLGIRRVPPAEVLVPVAEHYASSDVVVLAKGRIGGLRLVATDTGFTTGEGSEVRGPTLALIMAMTGRAVCCDDLSGDGVDELRGRC
ncbi:maleylpyruvate isomerase family mycothiol-dependent enzyme [Lentzea sp. NPDC058450]|uniref:maleylpyruvate isomerase family mycothiol-dependent enzyme n=1 Tax=Lentzea sp. NPDC058450 TaxID=3346505 RepID=UPI0036696C78